MDTEAAALEAFEDWTGEAASVVASAPGRVNLVGGHTDHQDGFVLPVAIDRRTAVAARRRPDRTVRVRSTRVEGGTGTATADLDALEPGEPRWADYVRGVLGELDALEDDALDPLPGMDLAVAGDVPLGAGLSSSASLELAVAAAADAVAGRATDREALALACWRAETGFVGLSCGVMDQFAAAFGDPAGALFLDCRTRERRVVPFDPDAARLLVVETDASHELADADSGYNDRVAECREAVETFADLLDRPVTALRDVTPADLDAHGDALRPTVRRRAAHVVAENERVHEAVAALEGGDYPRLGELLTASHAGYRDDFEVSFPAADRAVELASAVEGALGARLTGGGFGGSVLALVRPDAAPEFARRAVEDPEVADVYDCAVDGGVRSREP
jgi:galactokinase